VIELDIDRTARTHLYAIDAYARISGEDFRPEVFEERDVPAVRARYLEHFRKK
jgi:hypothetical protein